MLASNFLDKVLAVSTQSLRRQSSLSSGSASPVSAGSCVQQHSEWHELGRTRADHQLHLRQGSSRAVRWRRIRKACHWRGYGGLPETDYLQGKNLSAKTVLGVLCRNAICCYTGVMRLCDNVKYGVTVFVQSNSFSHSILFTKRFTLVETYYAPTKELKRNLVYSRQIFVPVSSLFSRACRIKLSKWPRLSNPSDPHLREALPESADSVSRCRQTATEWVRLQAESEQRVGPVLHWIRSSSQWNSQCKFEQ